VGTSKESRIMVDLDSVYAAYEKDPAFEHLRKKGFNFVPGVGNVTADIVFVGEAPGYQENKNKQPFFGKTGRFLNDLLNDIQVERKDVYLTNVLKYRPSDTNRDPTPSEIQASIPYLSQEIGLIQPRLVVVLGKVPCMAFLPGVQYGKAKGKILKYDKYKLLVTRHPMALGYSPSSRTEIIKHFNLIREVMQGNS
jgi:uracil-DNA glycosylase